MLEIYVLKIDMDLGKDHFEMLSAYLSDEKRERIKRFHRFEDAQRTLLGDILARYAICTRTRFQNKDLVFGRNNYGKPILLEQSGIHFNISHSGKWVALAVSDSPVGIDVEAIKPINFDIAERFFSKKEYLSLFSQPEGLKLKHFYSIWTLKESYIKAEGKGLSIPLDSFSIIYEDLNKQYICFSGNKPTKYYFSQWLFDNDTVCSICASDNPKNEINPIRVTVGQLVCAFSELVRQNNIQSINKCSF